MRTIRVGSRDSKLAVIQSNLVIEGIKKAHPDIHVELITMKTTGDIILDRNLDQIGGKGLFVKELDRALIEGRIDLSVHSLKDMPMIQPDELPILGYSKREDPRDALIIPMGESIEKEEEFSGKIIGSSSRRRTLQLAKLYPQATFQSIRGNVQTRLRKLEEENYSGIVLAMAGLNRLGLSNLPVKIFSTEEVIPAAGQGILAIQGRKDENYDFLASVYDKEARIAAEAERAFVKILDGGCSSPIAAYAKISGENIKLTGLYYDEASGQHVTGTKTGDCANARQIGEQLAKELKGQFVHGMI